jgi:hypothetical protein
MQWLFPGIRSRHGGTVRPPTLDRLTGEDDPGVLLVSACGKLQSMRPIIAGLAVGSALRGRFTQADPPAQLWYYQSLASCYQGRVPPALSDELTG